MWYRVKFGTSYIVVSSRELEEEVSKLVRFVMHGEEMDIKDALKVVHYLKKYKASSPAAVTLVKLAEKKILEVLKKTEEPLW
ncbi:MAG: hypothetical protein QXU26_01435 [Thermofilaceae archaeon]